MLVSYLLTGVVSGVLWAAVAVGFNLVFGITRMFHFAYGATFTVGAYTAYACFTQFHLSLWTAIIISLIVTGIVGAILEYIVYRPLRRRKASHYSILIASIGVMAILQNVIALIWGDSETVISAGLNGTIKVFNAGISTNNIVQIGSLLILSAVLLVILKYTNIGKAARALGHDVNRARIIGISDDRIYLITIVVTSIFLVPFAVLQLMNTGVTPYDGTQLILIASIAAFAGGIGSVSGAIIMSLLMGALSGLAVWIFPSAWQDTIVFVLIFLFIILKPSGLFGKRGAV
jgi:branched-chain amino acid transport system permease protein